MKIQRFSTLLSMILVVGLLLGFSNPQGDLDYTISTKVTDVSENTIELDDISDPMLLSDGGTGISVEYLKMLIEKLTEDGEITNPAASRSLLMHITALEHYADKTLWQKAVKHMDGFQLLLSQYQKMEFISKNTSTTLSNYANSLLEIWETTFDSNRVMDTIRHLSVDIGPRVAGTKEEKETANYLKGVFDSYGYDTLIQEFDIRDSLKLQLKNLNTNEKLALGSASGSIETDKNGVTGTVYDAGLGLQEDFSKEIRGNIALIQRGENTCWEKVQNATEAGAIGVIIYDNVESLTPVRPNLKDNRSSIPVVGTEKVTGESLLSQISMGEVEVNLLVRTQTNQKSQNIIAVKKPENIENPEVVYVSGHYDSVPFSPGANDDASGTATVVELARLMKDLPTDKELRFIAFGAEEIGLVGSNYYVSQLSREEIDRSAGNFQLEMIGAAYEPASYLAVNTVDGKANRIWDHTNDAFDKQGKDKEKLILFRRGSSDHVPFHNVGILAACFNMGTINGGLEPEYHTPHDNIENVSPERIQFAGEIINSAISDFLEKHSSSENEEWGMEEAS